MKNTLKILIVIISINFISCGSSKEVVYIEEKQEIKEVKESFNFHKLEKYNYIVYFKDKTRYSATVQVKPNDSVSSLNLAHKYVENLYKGKESEVDYIEVKPPTNQYGFITLK